MGKIIFLLLSILTTIQVSAAKVNPTPVKVMQKDGTILIIQGHGDEHFHWTTTLDGVIVCQQKDSYYIAEIDELGNISASTLLAHNSEDRNSKEKELIAKQKQVSFNKPNLSSVLAKSNIGNGISNIKYFPHLGCPKALVILVNFQDTVFRINQPLEAFDEYLNSTNQLTDFGNWNTKNSTSVKGYFENVSNGQFSPEFDVIGPITVSSSISYYSNSEESTLLKEACQQVDNQIDFSQYDSNNDGDVDLVFLICAGYSQSNSNNKNDIYPKITTTSNLTCDNKNIKLYGLSNELNFYPGFREHFPNVPTYCINGLGIFVHEFSHALGLPDMYSESESKPGLEYWDLMDGGEYNHNGTGYSPTPYTPWEKEVMGWQNISYLKNDTSIITLQPNTEAYKIQQDENAKQYAIIQNIQKTGLYTNMPGHGMLVYLVDYEDTVNIFDFPNRGYKPRLTILPADGELISFYAKDQTNYYISMAGDPFPGTNKVTQISSIALNDGVVISNPMYKITENANGTLTFNYLKENISTGIDQVNYDIIENNVVDNKVYTIDGRYLGKYGDIKLKPGIYILNRQKIIIK